MHLYVCVCEWVCRGSDKLDSHNQPLLFRWFSWGVASLLEGESRGLCLVQLGTK